MMTARAPLRQADIARVMRAAKRAGVAAELDFGGATLRIFPDIPIPSARPALDRPVGKRAVVIGRMAEDGEENW